MKVVNAAGSAIEEHSYDAWGNHRDPVNWNLVDFVSPLGIRGFTGHEYLPHFQLINMGGRCYDPVIGRFLSPDNLIQDMFNAQNFNKMSYALNNPLKFIDPTGDKIKWWQCLITMMALSDPASAAAVMGANINFVVMTVPLVQAHLSFTDWGYSYISGLFTGDSQRMENAMMIDMGLFFQIPGWDSPQTLAGNAISHFRNLIGQVDNTEFDMDRWQVLVDHKTDKPWDKWGFTLGPYINSQNINTRDDIYKHESGHVIQSRILGPLYLDKVAMSSFSSFQVKGLEYHDNCWYEVWANILGGAPEEDKYPRKFRYEKNWGNDFWYWPAMVLLPIFPH
jgi:RHS repeat-associated protein